MLHWIHKHYIPCLLLYAVILLIFVFLVLYGFFNLLLANGSFSFDLSQSEIEKETSISSTGYIFAEFDSDKIVLSNLESTEKYFYYWLTARCERDLILIENTNSEVTSSEPYELTGLAVDLHKYLGQIEFIGADNILSESLSGNASSKSSPLVILEYGNSLRNNTQTVDIDRTDRTTTVVSITHDKNVIKGQSILRLRVRSNTKVSFFPSVDLIIDDYPCKINTIIFPAEGVIDLYVFGLNPHNEMDAFEMVTDTYDSIIWGNSNRYNNKTIAFSFEEATTDYRISTVLNDDVEFIGDGMLYYSIYANTQEYPLHIQDVQIKNANANFSLQKEGEVTSINLRGSADDVLRSGVSLKPSIFNWISESIAILPTFLLTVFGGAITISLKMWDKATSKTDVTKQESCLCESIPQTSDTGNAKPSAAKPEACHCEPAPQRWRGNPYSRRPASIYSRRKAKADREKRIATSADASSQ